VLCKGSYVMPNTFSFKYKNDFHVQEKCFPSGIMRCTNQSRSRCPFVVKHNYFQEYMNTVLYTCIYVGPFVKY